MESVRVAAEAAAKPVAEEAARATIEQVARETLEAALAEEAASRGRVEQAAIAVAERVGRELVQLAFNATASTPKAAAGSLEATPVADDGSAAPTSGAAAIAETRAERATPEHASRRIPAGVLPWLGALTLAVFYLLAKSLF